MNVFTSPAAAWVASLAKAARAFALYDSGNAVIRQHLADFADRSRQVLAQGPLVLEIAPFEISSRGDVVYRERDRERSLAFRLFRDGVRGITVDLGASWQELLLLLQILAIRFTGIQQQEEDVVTLLWKAEFRGIAVQVVQGFAAEDEEIASGAGSGGPAGGPDGGVPGGLGSEGEGGQVARSPAVLEELGRAAGAASAAAALAGDALRSEPPAQWDEPLPRLSQPVPISYSALPPEALQDLRADGAPEALPAAALAAARDLFAEAARSGWSKPDADLDAFVREVRLYLLGEGELGGVLDLAGMVSRYQGGASVETDLLRELGDPQTVEAILRTVPDDAGEPPPKLAGVLALVRIDAILDLLAAEKRPARRTLLLGLARGRLPTDGEVLIARLPSLDPTMALELLTILAGSDGEHAARGAGLLLAHADPQTRLGALKVLEVSEGEVPAGPLLKMLNTTEDETLRTQVLRVLGSKGGLAAFEGIERWVEGRRELSLPEAEALGRALAQLAPILAARLFARWLRPEKGVFRAIRDAGHRRSLVWSAVSGLGALPGSSAQQQLEAVTRQASGDLRRHCLATLARRRHEGVPNG